MNLKQLETFFWTVNLGGFAAAAEKLYSTQSTVSMRIKELERTLGVELFDRTERKARLTPKGREVMEYAGRILDLSMEMEHRLAAPESITGTVRLGVAEVVSITWLPKLIKLIYKRYPQVRLEIDEALTGDLIHRLHNGELELVLAPGYAAMLNTSIQLLGTVEFAWMAGPDLALEDKVFSPQELAPYPIIGLQSQSFHHAAIEDWFQREHVQCRYLARCKSMAVAASLTAAGMGISYLPIRCYRDQIDDAKLKIVATTGQFQQVGFVAATSLEHSYSLAERIAELACEVSDFDR